MIFTDLQGKDQIDYYKRLLEVLGSLSNLFSDSETPYLNYRISENLFCKAFEAKNLSRSDVSADASKNDCGVGIKTFIEGNGNSTQKIAEFNKDRNLYENSSPDEIIRVVSELRNKRLDATKRIHKLENLIYHCIVRKPGKLKLFEVNMDYVHTDRLDNIVKKDNIIKFVDGVNEYSFNISKSTLYKRFVTPRDVIELNVQILVNPFDTLENILQGEIRIDDLLFEPVSSETPHIFLPLYSDRTKLVEEKSGLNQWNAGGRERNSNEVYIPIPRWIHAEYPDFFPDSDVPFDLTLPDGSTMNAKVCQDGGKALMSNPNMALGKWLLRDVLNLGNREILTSRKLQEIGLDSVVIYKDYDGKYSINFTKTGSFETFKEETFQKEQ